jgi:hypothetical protein
MLRKSCAVLMVGLLLLASGCAQQTRILSDPSGARVFVDGREVCTTPCTYDYKTGSSGLSYQVELRKEGFDPVFYRMTADEVDREARSSLWTAGLMIPGGSLLWVGSLFTSKLKESYHFDLREETPVVAIYRPGGFIQD